MNSVVVCNVRGVELRVHPLLTLVLAAACVLGRLDELVQALFALLLHECAHALAAWAFGGRIRAMEILPFGAALRMDKAVLSEWGVAAAGPIMSFVVAGVTAIFCTLSPYTNARLKGFLAFNLTLAVINLLPALPLDGGRVVKSLIQPRAGLSFAVKMTGWAGVAAGSAMLLIFALLLHFGATNLTLAVMGIFLLAAAIHELRALPEGRLGELSGRADALLAGEGVSVNQFAAHATMPAADALRLVKSNRYLVIRVLDDKLSLIGELDETALVLGMARLGTNASVGAILSAARRTKAKNAI